MKLNNRKKLLPSGRKYVFPKYDHGIVYFHFEAQNNEAGVWSFEARMHPIVTKTLGSMVSLEVFGQQSTSGKFFFCYISTTLIDNIVVKSLSM